MKDRTILLLLLSIIGAILLLHLGGTYLHFYWRFPLYDNVVHILASSWIALTILTIFKIMDLEFVYKRNIFIIGVCLTLIVGIGWEFFEYLIGQTSVYEPEFLGDTAGDILLDTVGGFVGSLYGIKILDIWNNKKQQ